MRGELFQRVEIPLKLLLRQHAMNEAVTSSAKVRQTGAHLLPVKQLFVPLVFVAGSRD